MNFIKEMYQKYKEIILYLIFGALTTLVNMVSFALLNEVCHLDWAASNVIAWILSVVFAYVTNRKYIFESNSTHIGKEIFLFFFFRVLSLGLDMLFMWLFIEMIGMHDLVSKLIVQVIVVVLNYVFSKLFVFAKK
ncbi:MAG: GtrA family protein [Ruminococcaceae bacterium]|nr:GtrA family protein [Oscillospiraceae bacterium]